MMEPAILPLILVEMIFPPRSTMLTLVVSGMVTALGPKTPSSARFSVLMESTTAEPMPSLATLLTQEHYQSSRPRLTLNSPGRFGPSPSKGPITPSFLVTVVRLQAATSLHGNL